MEETLPASAKANVEALYKQSEKLRFLIDSLVKLSKMCIRDRKQPEREDVCCFYNKRFTLFCCVHT